MKYTMSIDIDLPRGRVIELLDNEENMFKWQHCLLSAEQISGEPGQEGSKTKLVQKMGKREVEMVETITRREFPDLLAATYEAKGYWNEVINHFLELDGGRTQWRMDTEFKCTGMMRVMFTIMPFMFKKESQKYLQQFKAFAEGAGPA
jgi:hypothetical protein